MESDAQSSPADPDLIAVITSWATLPAVIKVGIMAMVDVGKLSLGQHVTAISSRRRLAEPDEALGNHSPFAMRLIHVVEGRLGAWVSQQSMGFSLPCRDTNASSSSRSQYLNFLPSIVSSPAPRFTLM